MTKSPHTIEIEQAVQKAKQRYRRGIKGTAIKIEYDKKAKAVYIPLIDIPDGGVDHTEEIVPNTIFLDKDKQGQIIGIEVLGVEEIVRPTR